MWISDRRRRAQEGEEPVQIGRVTIPGDPACVWTGSERRDAPLFGPGGYIWRPNLGDEVLVLKTGEGFCVAGVRNSGAYLAPGEVAILGQNNTQIVLRSNGVIQINGQALTFNGEVLAGKLPEEESGEGGEE
ncbi:MAG TPA: hypothetical protein H9841_01380 [Candidatus Flavonifractor merdigallinarum]|uniref:Baseplate assembly protein n=1 Tax=Candidatus Flavonifractor merdigallinarum TaxID=2838589 RepID=A0A9D2BY94_9FIRM|nr:hypothetical protein [Candidatus Flavonifractor merdigallinarum]